MKIVSSRQADGLVLRIPGLGLGLDNYDIDSCDIYKSGTHPLFLV